MFLSKTIFSCEEDKAVGSHSFLPHHSAITLVIHIPTFQQGQRLSVSWGWGGADRRRKEVGEQCLANTLFGVIYVTLKQVLSLVF